MKHILPIKTNHNCVMQRSIGKCFPGISYISISDKNIQRYKDFPFRISIENGIVSFEKLDLNICFEV